MNVALIYGLLEVKQEHGEGNEHTGRWMIKREIT